MLPLAVLAGLIGAGLYISRRELAETIDAPEPDKIRYPGGPAGRPFVPKKARSRDASPHEIDSTRASSRRRPDASASGAIGGSSASAMPSAINSHGDSAFPPLQNQPPSRHMRSQMIPGPFGEGPVAHFSNRDLGAIKQPTGLLDVYSGRTPEGVAKKSELPTFGDVHRQTKIGDVDRSRYEVSQRRDGTSPVSSKRVAPMSEDRTRQAAMPLVGDDLRANSNPILQAEGRMTAAPQRTTLPGQPGATTVSPRTPTSTSTTFAPGMSAVVRGSGPGEHFLPPTKCREGAHMPIPGAGRNLAPGGYTVDGNTLRHSNSELCAVPGVVSGMRRSRERERDVEMFQGDLCPPESASLPEPRLGGARSSAMGTSGPSTAAIEPSSFGDDGRGVGTRRALMDKNARIYSSVQIASGPPKQTVHEPEPLRTTLRETSIHDQGEGFIRGGPESGVSRSPDADARTTGRETLRDVQGAHGDGRLGGTTSVYKPPVYDPFDLFDTTTRETIEHNRHSGNIGSLEREGTSAPQPELDYTQRSLTNAEYFGDAAKPESDAYRVSEPHAPGTNRQVAPFTDYRGAASPGTAPRMMSGDHVYERVFSDARESTLRRRSPTGRRETLAVGADSVARPSRSRDHYLDLQPERYAMESQGRSQTHIVPSCVSETRGGRLQARSSPDPQILNQLESNAYAMRGPPV